MSFYVGPKQNSSIFEETIITFATEEYPELKKRYWVQHLWARGYFCATVGTVTEETVRKMKPLPEFTALPEEDDPYYPLILISAKSHISWSLLTSG